ncbi:glycosyltransferase [Candidatus Woesearchaeota archaeon]|nr:glycosyltransferase [Candidatus Woesearchaeota archaeon]
MTKTKNTETVTPELSVITITYNERENIRLFITVVSRILSDAKINGEIIVVDDSSPDGTSEVVLEMKKLFPHVTLIKRPGKMGIGSAYFTGFNAARGKVVAFLDADLSHAPEVLPELYDLATKGEIAFGSRYLGNTKFETDFAHRMGTYLLNFWIRLWLNTGVYDHTNGYIVAKKEILDSIINYGKLKNLHPFDHILYGITIAAIAKKLSLPRTERKATYNKRQHGETNLPFLWGIRVVLEDMMYTLRVRSKL